ncbi:MAG: hypothetical protein ACXV4B_02625 [Halobacteriota archaeon]
MLRSTEEEGLLQLVAGSRLICISGLLSWDESEHRFCLPSNNFDVTWTGLDDTFGRVVLWNAFSAGAEFFFKGFLMANGVEIRSEYDKVKYPPGTVSKEWIEEVLKEEHREQVVDFGTFNVVSKEKINDVAKLYESRYAGNFVEDLNLVKAARIVLARNIRNRDAHAYVPNIRNNHQELVGSLFLHAFNFMLGWLPPSAAVPGSSLPEEMTRIFSDTKSFVSGMRPY